MAKQKRSEIVKTKSKYNTTKNTGSNLVSPKKISNVLGNNFEIEDNLEKTEANIKETKEAYKRYLLRNRARSFLEEKSYLKLLVSASNKTKKKNKLFSLINEALNTNNFKYNIHYKISEEKNNKIDINENCKDNLENSTTSTTVVSDKFEEEKMSNPHPKIQKKSRSVRSRRKYTIDLLRLKGHFKEDRYFKLYADKNIGFKKSEIIREVKEKDNDFDVFTDDENLKIERTKVFNNLKKCAKNFLKNPEYLK